MFRQVAESTFSQPSAGHGAAALYQPQLVGLFRQSLTNRTQYHDTFQVLGKLAGGVISSVRAFPGHWPAYLFPDSSAAFMFKKVKSEGD